MESYRLCKGLKDWKSGQGQIKNFRAIKKYENFTLQRLPFATDRPTSFLLRSPTFNHYKYKNSAFRFITYYNNNLILSIHVLDRLEATDITKLSTKKEVKPPNETLSSIADPPDLRAALQPLMENQNELICTKFTSI
jgi:hypothetical protein